jgi:ABC-type lipoprotein release transport system permease subunit
MVSSKMRFTDILLLALRNLRQARLRAVLTTMGVIVGVAVIVTMVSFGLGLQRNMLARFSALDLFNEMSVFGKGLTAATLDRGQGRNDRAGGDRRGPPGRPDKSPTRILDDAAIAEIAKIRGVAYVEPYIGFPVYARSNGHVLQQFVTGATVPNASSRFKEFIGGRMISSPTADEAVVNERFTRDLGYDKPADAVGKIIEFLAPPDKKGEQKKDETNDKKDAATDEDGPPNFFGIPLEDDLAEPKTSGLVGRTFRIAGVLNTELKEGAGQGGLRGLLPAAGIYIPLAAAHQWNIEHRNPMTQVALALARESGALAADQTEGYDSAVIRVTDPVVLTDVRKRLTEMGLGSFSIVDQLDQIRVIFLIIDAVLGLLGGISLLVASFGIANTMIMSILERTREIGIMKAIGAEDREIKLIFFFEAAVLGLTGGVIGTFLAWGIDAVANRAAYRFILKPQGASFVDFFSLPLYLSIGAILFAVVISILAALYPATRAASIDPVKALRHD